MNTPIAQVPVAIPTTAPIAQSIPEGMVDVWIPRDCYAVPMGLRRTFVRVWQDDLNRAIDRVRAKWPAIKANLGGNDPARARSKFNDLVADSTLDAVPRREREFFYVRRLEAAVHGWFVKNRKRAKPASGDEPPPPANHNRLVECILDKGPHDVEIVDGMPEADIPF